MARIRSVHPELRTSESVAAWPREVRYSWVLLWGYLDDYGRGLDNARVIAADCYPLDDDVTGPVMAGWLDLFEQAGSLHRYEVDGKRYLHATRWESWQKPQHPGKVRIPPCPECEPAEHAAWAAREPLPKVSRKSHEGFVSPSPTRGRGSKESSKEGEGSASPAPVLDAPSTGGPVDNAPPPRFPDHCRLHGDVAEPGPCGGCADRRKALAARPSLALVPAASSWPPWCGECWQTTRHVEVGPDARPAPCPRCHPSSVEVS